MGFPGSVADATMWKQSEVWERRREYFEGGYHVLADKGKCYSK
jgi:hypothetical protein